MSNPKHLAAELCLALLLTAAAAVGCVLLAVAGYGAMDEVLEFRASSEPRPLVWETLAVTPDGEVLIEQSPHRGPTTYLDARRNRTGTRAAAPPLRIRQGSLPARRQPLRSRDLWDALSVRRVLRLCVVGTPNRGATGWYAVAPPTADNQFYFEGYDIESRRRVGFIGTSGFRDTLPPADDRFSAAAEGSPALSSHILAWDHAGDASTQPISGSYAVLSNGIVYLVNFAQRSAQLVFDDSPVLSCAILSTAGAGEEAERAFAPDDPAISIPQQRFLAIRTREELVLQSAPGKKATRFPLPPEALESDLSADLLPDGSLVISTFVAESFRIFQPGVSAFEFDVTHLNADGTLRTQQRITLHTPRGISHLGETGEMNVVTLAVPAPVYSGTILSTVVPALNPPDDQRLANVFRRTWLAQVVVLAIAIGLAWRTWRRQRTLDLPNATVWSLFVLLLGVPGYLGYRLHRRWPLPEVPPPQPTGLEVLAP